MNRSEQGGNLSQARKARCSNTWDKSKHCSLVGLQFEFDRTHNDRVGQKIASYCRVHIFLATDKNQESVHIKL